MNQKQKADALTYIFQRSGAQVSSQSIEALADIAGETSFPKQTTVLNIGAFL